MFVGKKQNASGSLSIEIISKNPGKYKVIRTVGCAKTKREEELFILLVKSELERI
jgi:hypothetical protein